MSEAPCPALPKPDHLARQANRLRQSLRPAEPTTLEFDLEEDHLPQGFFRSDLEVRDRRHLMLCRKPFTQLLTVNAFVRKEECAKQVPLVFVLMSGKKKRDYCKVK